MSSQIAHQSVPKDSQTPKGVHTSGLEKIYNMQKAAYEADLYPEYEVRLSNLKTLYRLIEDNSGKICNALNKDFGCRSESESLISDVTGSLSSTRYMIKNLKRLMRPKSKSTSIWYLPAKNKVAPMPIGVAGVMSPWNYPVHLMIAPVASALAAGNRVMAKMSELTPHTSALMQHLVAKNFPEDLFTIINGNAQVSAEFSSLPFDHLLFTGSTSVGRKIAEAAAKNLTPTTLELSGKSPAIVTENCDLQEAAKRIMWGKAFNSGQTCIAPDYALVHEDQLIEFIRGCRSAIQSFYPNGIDNDSYTSVINQRHHARLSELTDNAEANGVEVLPLSRQTQSGLAENKIPVTLIINPTSNCKIYHEEVFGPLLSVFTYKDINEVVQRVRGFEDPLAMYIFSHYEQEIRFLSRSIPAAGVSVNDTLLHFLQNDLPFGGRGSSGYGRYHGQEGFETFSHMQPMFSQHGVGHFTNVKLLYPPYGKLADLTGRLIRLLP